MVRYPDSFIEELRERADLLDIVGRHVLLKKQGSSWQGLCPFHHEKTPSFGVRPDQGYFKCFGCGAGGDIFNFIMKIKSLSFYEAIEDLAAAVGLPLPTDRHENSQHRQQREQQQQLLDIIDKARVWFRQQMESPRGNLARDYLHHRGLKKETIEHFGLGYAPPGWRNLLDAFGGGKNVEDLLVKAGLVIFKEDDRSGYDRFRDRIIFPIQNYQGRCIGFGGRLLAKGEPKYINSPETPLYRKGEVLYGLDQAQQSIRQEDRVIVVEGYMDLVALANHGIQTVVATLGTALTASHLRHIWKRTRHICFCFDGDKAGREAAWRALEMVLDGLEADHHVQFLFLPDGSDPDDVVRREGAQGFRARWEKATSLMAFFLRHLAQGLNTESPEGRAALVHRARPLLAKVADPLLRALYTDNLGQFLGIDRLQVPSAVQAGGRAESWTTPSLPPNSQIYRRQRGTVLVQGRNFEQALLAILLRAPDLIASHEEELCRLELENPQLSKLLSALIDLGSMEAPFFPAHRSAENNSVAPQNAGERLWKRLPNPEMRVWAEEILLAEEMSPELFREEFDGCLLNCQLRYLQRQIEQTTREINALPGDNSRQFGILRALKQEQKILRQRKCLPVLSATVGSEPA